MTGAVTLGLVWWLRPVLTPIAVAWLAKIALTPIVRVATRRRVPAALAAGVLVASVLATTAAVTVALSEPAADWVERMPADIATLQSRWEEFSHPSAEMTEVVEAVEELVESTEDSETSLVRVVDSTPLVVKVFNRARGVAAQFAIFLVLLYFMLANDRVMVRKWVAVASTERDRERALSISSSVEEQCGRYLLSITVINAGLGLAVGFAVAALGLPNPLLWGTAAGLLNFIPFVGAAVGILVVLVVGISSLPTLAAGALPAGAYLLLTGIEGFFVTPSVLGRTIKLSPVAVLLWLMLWGWLWGLAGALIAVPLLASVAIVCRHVPEWRNFATLVEA